MPNRLKLAIQKGGRLKEGSTELIKECGIHFQNRGRNPLVSTASNFPLEILYLRDDDIPSFVADKAADIGIVGENILYEKQKPVEIKSRLGFARCRLSIAVPEKSPYQTLQDIDSIHLATSYPKSLETYLEENNIDANIHVISGSVELAPRLKLAEGICDLVSSGSTLVANGLRELAVVFESEAVLIAHENLSAEKNEILEQLLFRIRAVNNARDRKYILLNAPVEKADEIAAIMPGLKSPTKVPLAIEGWVALHSVIYEDKFWEVIQNLKAAGAQGILVVPIEKLID